jgi:outer membrane murein-binding lipoprotein Lpp
MKKLTALTLLTIFVTGCASQSDIAGLDARLIQLEQNDKHTSVKAQEALDKADMANLRIDKMFQKLMGK